MLGSPLFAPVGVLLVLVVTSPQVPNLYFSTFFSGSEVTCGLLPTPCVLVCACVCLCMCASISSGFFFYTNWNLAEDPFSWGLLPSPYSETLLSCSRRLNLQVIQELPVSLGRAYI